MPNYRQLKDARVQRVAEMVAAFLIEQVNSAAESDRIELYKACYDFIDDPSFNLTYAHERICNVDPRPRDENGDIIDTDD